MVNRIYLFRHAQTYFNRQHRFTGWKDSKLTPFGVTQARKIARLLKDKQIQVAYHTRLSRSKDTLRAVLKYHPECREVVCDDRMIERSYGKLQGMTHAGFIEQEGKDSYKTLLHWHKIDHLSGKDKEAFIQKVGQAEFDVIHRSYNHSPKNGESIKMVEDRVKAFIKDLLTKIKKEKVNAAISAHGNSMRPFRRYFEKLSVKQMMELENPWDGYFEYRV